MFLRKADKSPESSTDQVKFKNFVCSNFGYTDETVQNLFMSFWPELVSTRPVVDFVDALTRLSSIEYFYKVGRKQSAFAAYCLMLAESLIEKSHPGYVFDKANNHRSILFAAIYYRLVSKNVDGYIWLCQNEDVAHEVWLYIKSGVGQFAPVLREDVLHVEDAPDDNVSDFDVSSIGSMAGNPAPAIFESATVIGSDSDALAALTAGFGQQENGDKGEDKKTPSFDQFM